MSHRTGVEKSLHARTHARIYVLERDCEYVAKHTTSLFCDIVMIPFMFRLLNFLLQVGMTCGFPNVCYKSRYTFCLQGVAKISSKYDDC